MGILAKNELSAATAPSVHATNRAFTASLLASLAVYAAVALWLVLHPPSLSSDDALFFLHALTRFSILDFSPQFPGYPGFVALGRLALSVAHDPLDALAFTTLLIALALPPLAALVAWRATGGRWPALLAFLLTLACPLLPDLALSLLSDGSGILFLLVFLALLPKTGNEDTNFLQPFLAGAALAFAGACRPSDAVLLATALLGALIALPRLWKPLLLGGLAVTIPVLTILFSLEGTLYVQEGLRFFAGNATLWGNTAFDAERHGSWLSASAMLPGGIVLIPLCILSAVNAIWWVRSTPAISAAALALLAHALWIVAFQNPDHLRHLAPILILGGLLLSMLQMRHVKHLPLIAVSLYALAALYCTAMTLAPPAGLSPPLTQAIAFLRALPKASIAANNGVFTLRALLPEAHVYDMHYPADATLGLSTARGPAYRMTTTTPADGHAVMIFPGRFAGEETMWLVSGNRPSG